MKLLALLLGLVFLASTAAGCMEVARAAEGKKVQQKKKEKVVQQGPGTVKKEPKK